MFLILGIFKQYLFAHYKWSKLSLCLFNWKTEATENWHLLKEDCDLVTHILLTESTMQ